MTEGRGGLGGRGGSGTEIEGGRGQPPINRRSLVSLSPVDSGVGGQNFGREAPKLRRRRRLFLENFGDTLEKLWNNWKIGNKKRKIR